MPKTVVSLELRGLGYRLDNAPLLKGAITVQGTNSWIRRVEGTGVVASPVAGEATVSFDLVSLPIIFKEATKGTIRITDPAAKIDVTVEVELSEARGRQIVQIGDPHRPDIPCIERQLVGVKPAEGINAATGTHRCVGSDGKPFLCTWTVDDGGSLPDTPTLHDVVRVAKPGFGSDRNLMAWAMAEFGDCLYVGTSNWKLDSFSDYQKWGFGTGPIDNSEGAEVWRLSCPPGGHGEDGTWTCVLRAGLGAPYNHGIRNMEAIGGHLYAITANHTDGCEIWRTHDGEDWTPVITGGFGSRANTSGRGLAEFGDYIYAGTENKESGAEIWRAPLDRAGDASAWERVLGGDVSRSWYASLVLFNGHLYAASLAADTSLKESEEKAGMERGCFVVRTSDGIHWEEVVEGGFGNQQNIGILCCAVLRDRLYFGTSNIQGCEVHSSADGVNWELNLKLKGSETRLAEPGEGDWHGWALAAFNDRLYFGLGRLHHIWWSGCGLWSTQDGHEWVLEMDGTLLAHYGIRTMTEYRDRLYIGTASFPDCATVMEAQRV